MKILGNDRGALLFLVMVLIFLLTVFYLKDINGFIFKFVDRRSEYNAIEQLSKFTLLYIVILAIKCLSQQKDKLLLKLSMVYLIFAMTMYLAESNMIKEKLQPVFAVLMMPFLFHGLFKKKAWLSATFLVFGLGVVTLGVTRDFMVESQAIADALPLPLIELITPLSEERLDMVGIGFIGLSALVLFFPSLRRFAQQGIIANGLTIWAVAMVAVGNGLSHYQYKPGPTLWLIGLIMALMGGLGVLIVNQVLINDEQKLFKKKPLLYCIFLFLFFIFLPSFVDRYSYILSLILWLTVVFTSMRFFYNAKLENIKLNN